MIEIRINTNTAQEARDEMINLLATQFSHPVGVVKLPVEPDPVRVSVKGDAGQVPEVIEVSDFVAQQSANDAVTDANKAKRTRRTKAEMQADAARASTAGTEPELPLAKDPLDIPPELDASKRKAKAADAKPLTIEDARASLSKIIESKGGPAVIAIVNQFTAADGTKCMKVSQVKPEEYQALIDKCTELLG